MMCCSVSISYKDALATAPWLSTFSKCAAACCSVLQCVAMCCNVLQHDAVCLSLVRVLVRERPSFLPIEGVWKYVAVCCSVLQCVAVCYVSRSVVVSRKGALVRAL